MTLTPPFLAAAFWRARALPLIIATALLMENLDSNVLTTSLPQIARDLDTNPIDLKLVLTTYLLALAIFIPASGWMADRFGARRVFRWAIVVFALGSIACGASNSLGELVAARALQGIGGSMMTPVGRLIVLRTTPKAGLVSALAWLTVPALLGPVLGPPVGGFITTYFQWRWIFWINIPIAVLGYVLASAYIPEIRFEQVRRFDAKGFLLVGPGLAATLTGVTLMGLSLASPWVIAPLTATGIALLAGYAYHALRVPVPLVDLRLLRLPSFRVSVTGGTMFRVGSGMTPFILPLLLQVGFGLTPFQSGMLTFASGAGALTMKFLAPPILRRFGFRRVLSVNAVLSSLFILAPAFFTIHTPWQVMLGLLFFGGLLRSLQFTSINAVAYADVPSEQLSGATSFSSVLQQLSGSVGITIAAFGLEAMQHVYGGVEIEPTHFPAVFMMAASLTLASGLVFARMSAATGDSLLAREEVITGPASAPVALRGK